MSSFVDISGRRFGRLVAISRAENKGKITRWLCICDCGSSKTVRAPNLYSGNTKSCGCIHKEMLTATKTTHGLTGKPEYKAWVDMVARCTQPHKINYPNWGGRGIKVCSRWMDARNFYEDMGDKPHPNLTLERRDNEGNYEPSNCYWATWEEQQNNKRPKSKNGENRLNRIAI